MGVERYDAVIAGSGYGGSIPALRLTEAGKRVLVLEWGGAARGRDFQFSWDPRYLARWYTTAISDDFAVLFRYARVLGGGSVINSGAMLRAPREVFDYVDPRGYRVWPESLTRAALDPFYDLVEEEMSIRQARWDEVPMVGLVFAMMLDRMGLTADRARFPFAGCVQCGFCEAGCVYEAKNHLGQNYIPRAMARGAEFRTGAKVLSLRASQGGYRVVYQDTVGARREVEGRIVLLAAGAIETPAILLRSRADLPDLSPHVGKNFSNNGDVAWYFALPEGHRFPRYRLWAGRNNAVMITYAFWDEHRITIHTGSNPPGVIAAVDIAREGGLPYGLAHKRLMRELYPSRLVGAIAIGLAPATGEVTIDGRGNVHVSLPLTPELGAYMDRVIGVARQMAAANGAEILRTAREGYERGGAHPLGTCRMGDDPRESVTTPEGEVRGTPGLFVTDASTLPGGTGANPALTIAANAERIARRIVERT